MKDNYNEQQVELLLEQYKKDEYKVNKYNHAGVYSISIVTPSLTYLVYIGKSREMLKRLCQHIVSIENNSANKYKVLREAAARGYRIEFDVLYVSKEKDQSAIDDDIGNEEGRRIRKHWPPLNYQIPKEENYHSSYSQKSAKTITLNEIIGG